MNKPELLAPAGNLEKLKYAAAYGADAVYFGCEFGSLRSFAGNFTYEEAQEGLSLLHTQGKKGYAALNIYPFSEEYAQVHEAARTLEEMGVDGLIVSDLGVLAELKRLRIQAPIHISTQANTVSRQTALAYKGMGARRVNLARELSLGQIRDIQDHVRGQIETEVFIHGAVCFSYSGRCAISDYMTGFRANRGQCKQPCRYQYALVEEKRPGEAYPVFEDERGQYFYNCKDLALFAYVPQLAQMGVDSFKIEGRMKSVHYVATTVSVYRKLIDGRKLGEQQAKYLLDRVPHRGYSTGFMKGSITPDDYTTGDSMDQATSLFVANVMEEQAGGKTLLQVRNKIHAGELLEMLTPDGGISQMTMPRPLITKGGSQVEHANNDQFIVLEEYLEPYTILRRVQE